MGGAWDLGKSAFGAICHLQVFFFIVFRSIKILGFLCGGMGVGGGGGGGEYCKNLG